MQERPHHNGGAATRMLLAGALIYVLGFGWPHVPYGQTAEWLVWAWWIGAAIALIGVLSGLRDFAIAIQKSRRIFRALRPKNSKASAKWLTARQARKAKLGGTKGIFLGILDGLPLFAKNPVHGLICAPARKGKTTSFVLPALCHDIGGSRIVADMKGELAVQTQALIAGEQGQNVIILNPAYTFGLGNAAYNPLQIILDDLEHAKEDAMADARSLAMQLVPEAPGGDRDPFWPNGTRKLIVFATIALCVLREEWEANLPTASEVLGDDDLLDEILLEANGSHALTGELATLAKSIIATRNENAKQFESFREGALQVLLPFGPSGRLAASVTHCDFRFRDLKETPTTLFMVCDYSRLDVFAPWLGLLVWAALKELVREENDKPVFFILDEFTNYRLPGLPNALTALAGYGIKCWMVVQELEEIARVYGREALTTIMSQTEFKQFFGVSSLQTAQLVSQMLGQQDRASESFSLNGDLFGIPGLSLGSAKEPLLTPDQIRQLPEDEQVIFIRNLAPVRALKIGYQEVSPWRERAAPNPLYGGKRFIGALKLKLNGARARSVGAGRQKTERPKTPLIWPLLNSAAVFIPDRSALLPIAGIAAVLILGWPQLRIAYTADHNWCRYAAIPLIDDPVELHGTGHCPLIKFQK